MAGTAEQARSTQEIDYHARRYNDTVTWLAEVLPGSMRTPFEYRFDGRELYANDGSALEKIFDDSIEQARTLPVYEQRRRQIEKDEYREMLAMMRGGLLNTMVVISDFPPELMNAAKDVGGYNVTRKQTMLRVLTRTPEGTLKMYSQSLDGSDRRALEAVYAYFGERPRPGELLGQRIHANIGPHEQEFLIDQLTGVYDRSLQARYGGEWYAGVLNGRKINTYDFVRQQSDLLNAYLATTSGFTGGFEDYSLAAAMKDRFFGKAQTIRPLPGGIAAHQFALQEMRQAGTQAWARGEEFSGCGVTASVNEAESQYQQAGYGNQADKSSSSEKLVWKKGVCIIDNCPTRPGQTEVAQCSICRGCQAHFDRGLNPAKIYKSIKPIQERVVNRSFLFSKEDNDKVDKAWLN